MPQSVLCSAGACQPYQGQIASLVRPSHLLSHYRRIRKLSTLLGQDE